MQSANDKILDAMTTRALDLQRLSAGQAKDVGRFLKTLEGDIVAQLARIDPTGIGSISRRAARLEKLLKQVKATIVASYRAEGKRLANELRELADIESKFAVSAINKGAGVELITSELTRGQLTAITGDLLVQGAPVSDWVSRQAGDTLVKFQDAMRLGIAQGETNAQLIRRVRGGKQAGEVVQGFMKTTRHHAESLVRSATQAVSQASRQAVYDDNDDIVKAEQWVSTIDLRTTVECSARDGLTYTVGSHEPIDHTLPWGGGPGNLHWGCRSTSAPVLKSFRELGFDIDEVPETTRSALDGQIAQDTTFEGWLGRQSVQRQNENLGVGRAALWRDGKISFRDLMDANGRELTLAELRAKTGAASTVVRASAPTGSGTIQQIFKGKTSAEIDRVLPAFANSDVSRLEIIRVAGNLSGGLTEGKGSYHMGSNMSIQMQKGYDSASYNSIMRHEYGHHIDARMEYSMMSDMGANVLELKHAMGPSRMAKNELKQDAIILEKSISKDTSNNWRAVSGKPTAGFPDKVEASTNAFQARYQQAVTDKALRVLIDADMAERGLDYQEVRGMFPHMFTDAKDMATVRGEAAKFVSAFDLGDHASLVYDARLGIVHQSPLAGLSDSLGAATNQRIGYRFGHKKTYYASFRKNDKRLRSVSDPFGDSTRTPTTGKYAYGTGNTAQLWANWFEAYTSGNKTQYAVFKKLFENTSQKFEAITKEFAENGTLKF